MGKTIDSLLRQRLRFARRERQFKSASAFAHKHHIPVNTYLNHESGRRSMKPSTITQYALLLKISLAWLISGEGHWDMLQEFTNKNTPYSQSYTEMA